MKITKNGIKKEINNPKTISRLKQEGWSASSDEDSDGDFDRKAALETLKAKGVDVHHATGDKKLKAMLAEHSAE
jgi:hypothetical protein